MKPFWVWTCAGRGVCHSALWLDGVRVAEVAPGRTGYYWTLAPTWWDLRGLPRPARLPFGRATTHQEAQRAARKAVLALTARKNYKTKKPPDVIKTAGGGTCKQRSDYAGTLEG